MSKNHDPLSLAQERFERRDYRGALRELWKVEEDTREGRNPTRVQDALVLAVSLKDADHSRYRRQDLEYLVRILTVRQGLSAEAESNDGEGAAVEVASAPRFIDDFLGALDGHLAAGKLEMTRMLLEDEIAACSAAGNFSNLIAISERLGPREELPPEIACLVTRAEAEGERLRWAARREAKSPRPFEDGRNSSKTSFLIAAESRPEREAMAAVSTLREPEPGTTAMGAPVYPTSPARSARTEVRTSGLAVASFVLSIFWLAGLGTLLAIIFGHVALGQIRRSNGGLGGRGFAIAGLVIAWATAAVVVVGLAFYFSNSG